METTAWFAVRLADPASTSLLVPVPWMAVEVMRARTAIFETNPIGRVLLRNQKRKRPNAEKLGIFSVAIAILPGEDKREFEELHRSYVEEWAPDGATDEEAVSILAKVEWLKRRVQKLRMAQVTKNLLDPSHPSFNEALGILGLARHIGLQPETGFDQYGRYFLVRKSSTV